MEVFAFAIMLIVTNAFFMIREIFIVINHNHEEDKTSYEVSEIFNICTHATKYIYLPYRLQIMSCR
jgi:hypothetical protein